MDPRAKEVLAFFTDTDDSRFAKDFDDLLARNDLKKIDIPRLVKQALDSGDAAMGAEEAFRLMSRLPLKEFRRSDIMGLVPTEKLRKLPPVSSTWGPQTNSVENFTGDHGLDNLPPLPGM